jgi:L-serine dehydratase
MYTTLDLFKVGVGPSSSHTVGPMIAAARFAESLAASGRIADLVRVEVTLYGSLALTGLGHATDRAVLWGLSGLRPATIDIDLAEGTIESIRREQMLLVAGAHRIAFHERTDIRWMTAESLPRHPNGMAIRGFDVAGDSIASDTFYSLGGGFVVNEQEAAAGMVGSVAPPAPLAFPFTSGTDLLRMGRESGMKIAAMVDANEQSWRDRAETQAKLDEIWQVMAACIERGCRIHGVLPGGLNVRRRAASILERLEKAGPPSGLQEMDWLSLFALAVNEENAAGGRVVTAPTNGAAGVIPAVLMYYHRFVPGADAEGIRTFLMTAAAIGMLYKRNASLSAAEMGCQGEVGVACSMAAAGLAAVMGGTNEQVENAAEIGMEHHLGLTCDPIRGLVQVPCIERNTMGATKAVNAARLAVLYGDGHHHVSLDRVIATMRQTGIDMQSKYKETSLGGLAVHVNVTEC